MSKQKSKEDETDRELLKIIKDLETNANVSSKIINGPEIMDIRANMRKLEGFLKQDFEYPMQAEEFLQLLVQALSSYENICCDVWDIFDGVKNKFLLNGIIRELKRANVFKNYIFELKVPATYKNNVIRALAEYFASEILTSGSLIEDDKDLNNIFEELKAKAQEK